MKAVICLLFPVLIFAQNPFPDTLHLTDGKTYPCLITSIDDTKVEFLYLNNKSESLVLKAVDQLSIEELGAVYSTSQGFTKNVEQVNEFVNDRLEKMTEEQLEQQELVKLSAVSNSPQMGDADSTDLAEYFAFQKAFQMKKWSFGVLLIPYYSGTTYRVIHSFERYPPKVITTGNSDNEINMQCQLSFRIVSKIMLTLDVTYTSTHNELRSEFHNSSGGNEYDSGTQTADDLSMFDFSLGLKYYALEFFPNNVNFYLLVGFGHQFAFAEVNGQDLYPGPEPVPFFEDNMAEYLEGLNSPWHLDFGFGVEYFFNESLSLNSNIRFIYSSISSEYNYSYSSEYGTENSSIEYSNSEFKTRIGLGLNFYF